MKAPCTAPKVVFWFRLYCAFALVVVLLIDWTFVTVDVGSGFPVTPNVTMRDVEFGIVFAAIFLTPYVVGLFSPRRAWSWYLGLILICGGFAILPFTVLFVVPLLLFWLTDETKAYFLVAPLHYIAPVGDHNNGMDTKGSIDRV